MRRPLHHNRPRLTIDGDYETQLMDERAHRLARLSALQAEIAALRAELGLRAEDPALSQGLSEREALLVKAEQVVHLGSWTWDLQRDEIAWSDEFHRILGFIPGSLQPSAASFFGAIHPDDRERVRALTAAALAAGALEPIELRVVRPAGEVREICMDAALVHDASGERTYLVGTVLDVTEQRRAAALLARTVGDLSEAQRVAGLGSFRWDPSTTCLEWSDGMFRLHGLAIGAPPPLQNLEQLVHPDDRERVLDFMRNFGSSVEPTSIEYRIAQPGGAVLDVVMLVHSERSEAGALRFHGVIQDSTERKALEAQLRHSQKMEAVGTLAGGVAHDFNNYLMVIAGHTELLNLSLSADHSGRESLQAIGEAYERCAHLTQQLLTLSHKRKAEPRTFDLGKLVTRLSPLLRSALSETVRLRLELDEADGLIVADPLQVEQVIMNLVVNARDAMPGGGELILRVERVYFQRLDPHTDKPQTQVRLSVIDNGTGIAEELRPRIFEPFFTTKQVGHGTGLGLSTVYAIVREAGASIAVESEMGRGTRFQIDWPLGEPSEAIGVGEPLRPAATGGKQTILVVEDVARVRKLLCLQLERAGYRVLGAPDGAAALGLLAREHVDLVLSDVIMPRLGGVELLREIARAHPQVHCLLMTGYAAHALEGAELATLSQLLRKPFTAAQLLAAIRRALEPVLDHRLDAN
jgi:two-component system cell cycle sensor histidine kinase/response regulator CckA